MNFVYLSPHFPPHYHLFAVHLHRQGVRVLGIADQPFAQLHPELQEALADYRQVDSLEDYDQVLRACGGMTQRHGKLDRVESHNEHWLMLEARLREDFNLEGRRPGQMAELRRKSVMKGLFERAGIRVARGIPWTDLAAARAFANEVGYPLIAKPDTGVGASGACRLDDDDALAAFAGRHPDCDYFLEAFIKGTLLTFDGLCDQDGRVVYHTGHYSPTGVLEVVVGDEDLWFWSLRDLPADLDELGRRAVAAFDIREKFFHLEFLRRESDGLLFAMEMNLRPPGGFITDMMNFGADIDVYAEWASVIANNRFAAAGWQRKYHVAHIARKHNKQYRLSHDEVLARYGDNLAMVCEVPPIFSPVMGNLAYIARSPRLEDLQTMVAAIQARAG